MNSHEYAKTTTRKNFLEAFWDLYTEKPIYKITVKDICIKAGYNRSTFYEYFLDAYDCLEQIEESLIPDIQMLPPNDIIMTPANGEIPLVTSYFEENEKYLKVLLGRNGNPEFVYKLKEYIKSLIMPTMRSKLKATDIEIEYICEYNLCSMIGILTYYIESGKNIPVDSLVAIILRLNTDGIKSFLPPNHKS